MSTLKKRYTLWFGRLKKDFKCKQFYTHKNISIIMLTKVHENIYICYYTYFSYAYPYVCNN